MGDQFISGVNFDEVLDNVLKGNEYNDKRHLSVTMIKNGLVWHLYNNFIQHGYDIPSKMLGYIVGVRQTVQELSANRMRIKRLCAKISTLRQGKQDSFFLQQLFILHVKDLPENKNVEVKITKCTTTQTDNATYSEILRNVNKSKYELSALEKYLRTVRAKLSWEK